MKSYLAFIILILASFSIKANAENGDWKIYASYHNATKAIKVGTRYFVLASGSLFVYDSEDSSLGAYDKSNALSDFGIYDIAYIRSTHSLFILYTNGNIDIMNANGGCRNMPELKNKTLKDKTLNEVTISGTKAFISTNSGIVEINTKGAYFENLYDISKKVIKTVVSNDNIFAITPDSIYMGSLSENLLDAINWKSITEDDNEEYEDYLSAGNENIYDEEALAAVKNIIPDSPIRNYSYKLNMVGERLLVAGGNWYYPEKEENYFTGTAMKYENNRWTMFDEDGPLALVGAGSYKNITDIVQDPNDTEHHWIGTKQSGIYEFKNYKLVNHISYDNSPLDDIKNYGKNYVRVTGLQYDNNGNLWMCNNQCDTIVRVLKKDGKWRSFYINSIKGYPTFDNIIFDQRGWAWINHRRTSNDPVAVSGIVVINTNNTIDDKSDDKSIFIKQIKNQDGKSYTPDRMNCITEDINGAIWIGCNEGVFASYNPDKVFDSGFYFTQIKVSRNDGSNLADYLLSGVEVKCIAIDGGNRKWIGTSNNGVYLISADGTETIEHFTKSNSPLISDEINDIAINGKTGEVFFATTAGLCSYISDATDASESMEDNTLKVYPNPVRPEYSGEVHITGLMFDSNVKIVNAAGKLVYEGTSIGGEFSWNCCYKSGKKCGSGIYYALCTDENGKKGACTKILIVK